MQFVVNFSLFPDLWSLCESESSKSSILYHCRFLSIFLIPILSIFFGRYEYRYCRCRYLILKLFFQANQLSKTNWTNGLSVCCECECPMESIHDTDNRSTVSSTLRIYIQHKRMRIIIIMFIHYHLFVICIPLTAIKPCIDLFVKINKPMFFISLFFNF